MSILGISKGHRVFKSYTESYHTRNGKDITIRLGMSVYANKAGFVEIESLHGEKNVVLKGVTLSLTDIIELRDMLTQVIDNADQIIEDLR